MVGRIAEEESGKERTVCGSWRSEIKRLGGGAAAQVVWFGCFAGIWFGAVSEVYLQYLACTSCASSAANSAAIWESERISSLQKWKLTGLIVTVLAGVSIKL